jgi:hypothetical protein
MKAISLQCGRMAAAALEYCAQIETFVDGVEAFNPGSQWLTQIERLLPRLHVAVIALSSGEENYADYHFYDDDQRCELYMRLYFLLQVDRQLWSAFDEQQLPMSQRLRLCDRLADDLADMYFDLKHGLELLEHNPRQAASDWQCSFYVHWGRHLLDAEFWLPTVVDGARPTRIRDWHWPVASLLAMPA